jgi:3-hydroxyisobutyrate dehydrogenase-like beta-hydroxyacid dehydrogenase
MKVGFIGIGQMGRHMSRHVLEAGYGLTVHDLRKDAAKPLLDQGVEWADTPKAVTGTCRVVISCLPTPTQVQDIVYGANGLMAGWKTGDIYIDMSTNSPAVIRQVAKDAEAIGVKVLDAPVTGGTQGAERGTLTIMVGGDQSCLQKILGILQAMGNKIIHVGDVGCGNVAKLVNNLISLTSNTITAEAFVLGVKAGVDPQVLWEITTSGTANNWNLQQYPQTVFQGNFEPGFRLSLGSKDIGLALQLGREYGVPLFVGAAVEQSLLEAKAAGLEDKSVDAVALYLEKLVGVEIRTTKRKDPVD